MVSRGLFRFPEIEHFNSQRLHALAFFFTFKSKLFLTPRRVLSRFDSESRGAFTKSGLEQIGCSRV